MVQASTTAVPLFVFAMLPIPILLFLFWLYAAAQTRMVSEVGIRRDSWKFVRPFKGIICDDISEIAEGTLITERPPRSRVESRREHGLRMMPSFSRPSLSFRTAGFPRFGGKAGM